MKVAHKLSKNFFENELYKNEVGSNIGFLTANRKGDFASFFNQNQSRYQGWFFRNFGKVYRAIEDISLIMGEGKIIELRNEFWRSVRVSKINGKVIEESFFLPEKNRGLVYETTGNPRFNLFLDFKPIYDNSDAERFYKIDLYKKNIIIECKNQKEKIFLAVKMDAPNFSVKEQWQKRTYSYDIDRNSPPYDRYVFWAAEINASKMVIGAGDTKKQALEEANYIFNKTSKLKEQKKQAIKASLDLSKTKNSQLNMAYYCAQNSLRELIYEEHNKKQISAGLPWFFQSWARDSFISMKTLLNKNENLFWKICFQDFNQTADSIGWLFKRIGEVIEKNKVNEITAWRVKKYLEKSLENLEKILDKTTWMDSIDRSGERIETQALKLYMLKMAYNLTNDSSYKIAETSLKFNVKEKFWNGKIIKDGPNDNTIRPNVFLAYYIYPELLEQKEWQLCFDNVLSALWLPWGGVSTIDKNSIYFNANHTGENSQSYHSGDSWFYINNLTAIVLKRNNPERYRDYIDKILEASTKEILTMGAIGCHGELSSASELKSQGCWSQAWSNAMFIELVREMKEGRPPHN